MNQIDKDDIRLAFTFTVAHSEKEFLGVIRDFVNRLFGQRFVLTVYDNVSKSPIIHASILYRLPKVGKKYNRIEVNPNKIPALSEPQFKSLRGFVLSNYNWGELGPWFLDCRYSDVESEQREYKEIRHLETPSFRTVEMIETRLSMMALVNKHEQVTDFFNLNNIHYFIEYLQLLNTQIEESESLSLIQALSIEFPCQ
ncbi:MAG: hypothetical protein H6608_09750 [Flavobacteriales bacterium]|nr:hypothetical protein [Bacteroidota bacterium]MCB9241405.1 hypothetical protein [Flavobacteriales bacterium]